MGGLLFKIPILLGFVIAPIVAVTVKGKRLGYTIWNAGFFFGWLVAPAIASTSLKTQIGSFIVVQLLFMAVWFSSVNYASHITLSKPAKTPGNVAVALYFITAAFSFAWAIKTEDSLSALGLFLLIWIFGVLLTMGIHKGLDELKANKEEMNPSSLGVLLFMAYVPFLFLWGGVMKSDQLTLFATVFFGVALLAGVLITKHCWEKNNIHEPPNLY